MCEQIRERLHAEAEPEVVVEAPDPEPVAEAAVEIAQIEAERDVEIAKLDVERDQIWQEGRVSELEGQVRGMREILDRLVPTEPEAEPVVVVADPEPEPEPEPVVSELPPAEPKPAKAKKSSGWF